MDRVKGKPRLATLERHHAQYLSDLHRQGIVFVGWRNKHVKTKSGHGEIIGTDGGSASGTIGHRTLNYHQGKFGYFQ